MKDYLHITRLLLKLQFKRNPNEKGKNASTIAYIVLGALIAVVLSAAMATFGGGIREEGFLAETASSLMTLGFIVVLVFGTLNILSYMYFAKDNEFLISMPVSPKIIFASKLSVVYVMNVAFGAVIIVPSLLFLGIGAGLNALFFIMIIVAAILVPVAPLLIASLLAFPLMLITAKLKNQSLILTIVSVVLLAAVMGLYMFFSFSTSMSAAESELDLYLILMMLKDSFSAMAPIIYPLYSLGRFMTMTAWGGQSLESSMGYDALIFFGTVVVAAALVYLISGRIYGWIVLSQSETTAKRSSAKKTFVESSVIKSLMKREWREMSRTSSFAMQCLAGLIIAPLMVGVISGMAAWDLGETDEATSVILQIAAMSTATFFLFMLGIGLNIFSSTAITREGKTYELSKTLPVDFKTQMKAKLNVGLIISYTTVGLSLVVFEILQIVAGNYNPLYVLIIGVPAVIFNYGYNCYLINRDLRAPKLNWTTAYEAVKGNTSLIVPILICGGIGMVVLLICGVSFTVMAEGGTKMVGGALIAILLLLGGAFSFTIPAHKALNRNVENYYIRLGE